MANTRKARDGDYDGGVGEVVCVIGWIDGTWCLKFRCSVHGGFRYMDLALDGEMRMFMYKEGWDSGV